MPKKKEESASGRPPLVEVGAEDYDRTYGAGQVAGEEAERQAKEATEEAQEVGQEAPQTAPEGGE